MVTLSRDDAGSALGAGAGAATAGYVFRRLAPDIALRSLPVRAAVLAVGGAAGTTWALHSLAGAEGSGVQTAAMLAGLSVGGGSLFAAALVRDASRHRANALGLVPLAFATGACLTTVVGILPGAVTQAVVSAV